MNNKSNILKNISGELLPNGFVLIYDYYIQMSCLYNEDMTYRCGPARDKPEYRGLAKKILDMHN